MNNNFTLTNLDTDSISFCNPDFRKFTKEEDEKLLKELNSLFPEEIKFAPDGEFEVFIVLRAKNYIMYDGKKIKLKGSSLKSATLEPILKEMLKEFIDCLVFDKMDDLVPIYHKYVKMALDIKDIKPWSKKMTLSSTTFNSTRKNETKVVDAIQGTSYGSGDRIYVYSRPDDTLKLTEQFDGVYDIDTYLEKVFKTTKRFETILPVKELFLNYSLKRNKIKLEELK